MRVAPAIVLTEDQERTLQLWSRGRSLPARQVERAQVVLLAAAGKQDLELVPSFPPLVDLRFQKPGKVGGIVGADPQDAAIPKMDDDTIPAPQIPDPTAPDAVVNAPPFEDQRASDFGLHYVGVTDRKST